MTTYSKQTLAKRRKYSRLWRKRNKANIREYDKKRYEYKKPQRQQRERERAFGDRRCLMCGILLKTPAYGARGTRLYCGSCFEVLRK